MLRDGLIQLSIFPRDISVILFAQHAVAASNDFIHASQFIRIVSLNDSTIPMLLSYDL